MPTTAAVIRGAALAALPFACIASPLTAQGTWPPAGCPAPTTAPPAFETLPAPLRAQLDSVALRYRKVEACVPMRDGVRLYTAIYVPKDAKEPLPFMMQRTPYSVAPYGAFPHTPVLGPNRKFMDDGFIVVYQDVRGRFMSEGYFAYMTPARGTDGVDVDESTDTHDTIEWLLKNVPGHNGKVGLWGISAPGMLVAASMVDAHPALVAASPQAPMMDWYHGDDRHKHGAFTLAQTFNFMQGFARARPGPTTNYGSMVPQGQTDPDGYRFFLEGGSVRQLRDRFLGDRAAFFDSIMAHPNYDRFWQLRSLGPRMKDIRPAVLVVGGWYDGEDLLGPFEAWRSLGQLSRGTTRHLVVGPWWHGGWSRGDGDFFGLLQFPTKTSQFYRDSLEFPFFRCHLKGRCDGALAAATMYRTGADTWHRFPAWPVAGAEARALYLHEGGRLAWTKPTATSAKAFDAYVSDPAKPVPYTMATSFGYYRFYRSEDQRFAASRPDVLVYESAPLEEDVTIGGPLDVTLYVASTGTDADFVVKLIDVHPNDAKDPPNLPAGVRYAGMQQLVRGDVVRARWRRSYERPQPLVPGKPDSVQVQMPDVLHTFRRGHRIMVHVQSSWFPLIDRNPQVFVPNIYEAKPADFRAATMQVFRSAARASRIDVQVVPEAALEATRLPR
ncbi:MAG: CocE/NonD family hydrolase [Gemmatimonadales bacterium]|nr:CocE/NonD family hydrolase [Gemmatimonadales bacterium]